MELCSAVTYQTIIHILYSSNHDALRCRSMQVHGQLRRFYSYFIAIFHIFYSFAPEIIKICITFGCKSTLLVNGRIFNTKG